ncbi:MAG TPA: hypothetical protein VFC39_06180 [Acidobacteriaceae bacterium]|nr:hypothetical protein [Acidobacteriaceae bacterium]
MDNAYEDAHASSQNSRAEDASTLPERKRSRSDKLALSDIAAQSQTAPAQPSA